MKILLVHPGSAASVHDVYEGLAYGLRAHNVEVIPYGLFGRIKSSRDFMHYLWRRAKNQQLPKPTWPDILYDASSRILERAVRHEVDLVLAVSGFFLHPDALVLLRRVGVRTGILFTESPYSTSEEIKFAQYCDVCWTNERTAVPAFRQVCPRAYYLPHAWHPLKHSPALPVVSNVPVHDVVFVGTAWAERQEFFAAIDWTGVDLGIYGPGWKLPRRMRHCLKGEHVPNEVAGFMYRRAAVGINLHRSSMTFDVRDGSQQLGTPAESANPRAWELAALGAFHISDRRAEVVERFGDLVPTFGSPKEAEDLIRRWIADPDGRAAIARQLPALVAEDSWITRTRELTGHLRTSGLFRQAAA